MQKYHQFPVNPGELGGLRACELGTDQMPAGFIFFPLCSYIIRNAKKWCTSKIAIPEDAAITAYVVSWFNTSSTFRFSVLQTLMPCISICFDPIGISKDHVSLHGPPLLGDYLTIRTPNGLRLSHDHSKR